VVRVDDIAPAAMPTVDAVRARVTAAWTAQENARLLTARADALTARLRAGEDIAAVAASAGAPLVTGTSVTRDEAGAARYGQGAVLGLFGAERNQPFSQPGETGLVIGRVDRISAPTAALAADEALRWRAQLAQTSTQALFQSTVDAATQRTKASYDEARAREALGVAPAEAAPAQPARR
jgi:peptidyl-prolyl cis-trans isomerase D